MRQAAVKTMNDQSESIEPPSSTGAASDPRRPSGIRRWLKNLRNGRNGGSTLRETLEELIEQHEERDAPIDPRERQLIERILTVGDMTVDDVMVPRADIIAVECKTPLDEVVALMAKETHSRLPVYRESLDEVIGMVHIKDLLAAVVEKTDRKKTLPEIVRPVIFVAPSMRVLDLLLQMRLSRRHMALVVDEYGGVDGLVTIEDTVEQIVGEIEDEHDETARPSIEQRPDGTIVADARVPLDEFEATIGPILTDEERQDDIETLGGLVFSLCGRVPMRGEVVVHEPSRQIFKAKGFEGEALEAAVKIITERPKRWVDTMMREEHGMPAVTRSPLRAALYTFLAFVLCGSVPLIPYALRLPEPELPSTIMTGLTFFAIGSLRSRWSPTPWWRAGLETLAIGLLAAGVAYLIGGMLKGFM
jgi:Mg2+/Co2+ transporter CorC